jgi:hypothetical protein
MNIDELILTIVFQATQIRMLTAEIARLRAEAEKTRQEAESNAKPKAQS